MTSNRVSFEARQFVTKEFDAAPCCRLHAADCFEQGALASPVWADEGENLTLVDLEAHTTDGRKATEVLLNVVEL